MTSPPYRDASRPLEERLEDLLARMTLPEKVGQMLQLDARGDLEDVVATKLAGSILHLMCVSLPHTHHFLLRSPHCVFERQPLELGLSGLIGLYGRGSGG